MDRSVRVACVLVGVVLACDRPEPAAERAGGQKARRAGTAIGDDAGTAPQVRPAAVAMRDTPAASDRDGGEAAAGSDAPGSRYNRPLGPVTRVPPRVTVGHIEVEEGLPEAAVRRRLEQGTAAALACYRGELPRRPDLEGRVALRLDVARDGHVKAAEVVNATLESQAVHRCLTEAAAAWRFPRPRGDPAAIRSLWTFRTTAD